MIEADAYHPPANVAKMRAGVPLTDGDRAGWLAAMAARLAGGKAREEAMVVTCSALKRAHRDRLRDGGDGAENSCRRAWTRAGVVSCPRDCWGASSTLEIPNPATERCLHVSITLTPEQICATVAAAVVASPETTQTPPPPLSCVLFCLGRRSGNGLCLLATSPWERTASSTGRDGQTGRVNACSESYFDFLEKRVLSSSRKIEREVLEDFAIKGGMGVGVCRLH